jgi:hypothetical protein
MQNSTGNGSTTPVAFKFLRFEAQVISQAQKENTSRTGNWHATSHEQEYFNPFKPKLV